MALSRLPVRKIFGRMGLRHLSAPVAILAFAAALLTFATAQARIDLAQAAEEESPAPQLLPAEKEHLRKLDAALKPLLDVTPSASDAEHIRDAVAAIRANNLSRFSDAKSGISDPTSRKLVDWVRLRSGYGEASEYKAFLADNPLWPDRTMLTQRLEEALFTQGGTASTIKSYFNSEKPATGVGYAALASAYLAEGNKEEAQSIAAKVWREMDIPSTLENGFLARFGSLLTASDHKWRFDRMVTDDVRWAGNRADRSAFARRVIPLLPASEQRKATARLAVFNKAGNAAKLMSALPEDSSDLGLTYHRIQLMRKAGKVEEAAKIILAIPPDPQKIADIDEWWAERRELAYASLKAGNRKLAYELTKGAGPLSVNPLKEQTFMAGWIALRYLKDAPSAEKHFKALRDAADGPLSRAKAAYWLARTAEVRGDKDAAAKYYREASKNPDTFHGLLSMQILEPGRTSLTIDPPELPTSDQLRNFINSDAAKATVIAKKANLTRGITRAFLTGLRAGLPSEAEAGMVAHLAEQLGDTQMSLRIAKAAVARGQNLLTYAYPVHPFPSYHPLRSPPELAFLLGIARQETEFETQTVSGAGAKGLLQVMTITARHVCRDYKIKCDINRLLADKQYNVMIASAYIADRMEEFGGSYVLGLAGYNAGPGRARQWIRENGDPRDSDVDPIDWIERIPFTETREYVTKVLSNIQIYRARLGDTAKALRVKQDLVRARGSHKMPGSDDDPARASTSDTEG